MESDDEVHIVGVTMGALTAAAPHFRYLGCPTYPAITTAGSDATQFCGNCYCYMCDKPAAQCEAWTAAEAPHCKAAPRRHALPDSVDYEALRAAARRHNEAARNEAAWAAHSKPRVSGAWTVAAAISAAAAGTWAPWATAPPAAAPLPWVPPPPAPLKTPPPGAIPCKEGNRSTCMMTMEFKHPAMVKLHSRGWVRRMFRQHHTPSTESTAPPQGLCLDNWPARGAERPVLKASPVEEALTEHLGELDGIFVSVVLVTPPQAGGGGSSRGPLRREFFELPVGSTLGALLDALEARAPATAGGAWRGNVVAGGATDESTTFLRKHVLGDNAAVHAFDVGPRYMWVLTDSAPPIAVTVTEAHEAAYERVSAAMDYVPSSLVSLAHSALAALCEEDLPPPMAVKRGPAMWKPSVGTLVAVFPKTPLLLCGTFADAAFAKQPEEDAGLHDALMRAWLRERQDRRGKLWDAVRAVTAQTITFCHHAGDIPASNVVPGFTATVKALGVEGGPGTIKVSLSVNEGLAASVVRNHDHPGGDRTADSNIASYEHRPHYRTVVEELRARTEGPAGALRRAVEDYRYRHTFGRDTATVLRMATQGSIMRRRSGVEPPAWMVAACRAAGLFEWQTRQVAAFVGMRGVSTEWLPVRRSALAQPGSVEVFVHASQPAIRIGAPSVRAAAAMVNPTGSGKTIVAAMLARLPMWEEQPAALAALPPPHMDAASTDAREIQLRAKRAQDVAEAGAATFAPPAPVDNAVARAGLGSAEVRVYRAPGAAAAGPGVTRGGVLFVVPPSVIPQWAAELRRMGVEPLVYYAEGKKNFAGSLGFQAHRAVVTSIPVFSRSGAALLAPKWWAVVFDESQLATTKTTGASTEKQAYERARSDVETESMLFLSATPLGDVKDMRAWLKDARRDLPQHSLTDTMSATGEPLAPCVAHQLVTCFLNEEIPSFLSRKPALEDTLVTVPMHPDEAARYRKLLLAGDRVVRGSGGTKTMRSVLTKLTSCQPVLLGDLNVAIPRKKAALQSFDIDYPPTGAATAFAAAPAGAGCAALGLCCTDREGRGLLFQCGHWTCVPCGGMNTHFAANKCPVGCPANNAEVLKAVAAHAYTQCTSKADAIVAEVAKDLARKPTAQFIMMGSSDEANSAVCARLKAAGIAAHKLDSGTTTSRWVDRFKAGEVRVLMLNRNQNAGLDLFTADHVYVLSPPETDAVRKQILGRVMRVSTLSATVVQREFCATGIDGITTIDQELRQAAAEDADGNAKLPDEVVKRLFRLTNDRRPTAPRRAAPAVGEDEDEDCIVWDTAPARVDRRAEAANKRRNPNKRKRGGKRDKEADMYALTSRFFKSGGGPGAAAAAAIEYSASEDEIEDGSDNE